MLRPAYMELNQYKGSTGNYHRACCRRRISWHQNHSTARDLAARGIPAPSSLVPSLEQALEEALEETSEQALAKASGCSLGWQAGK
mmetsp:Transcript_105026/g.277433  ORF Transcript_105026/g.277433 Transcript_105026/m.277433 type:complete len:86 (-) Transcript_105026:645-902(-)